MLPYVYTNKLTQVLPLVFEILSSVSSAYLIIFHFQLASNKYVEMLTTKT